MIKKIIMVFKTHFDIGFTDLAENVISSYTGSMLDDLLSACDDTKNMGRFRYIWTMPVWPLKVMTEGGGVKRKKLDALIQSGQVVWHALPFTSHFDFSGLEDSIQSLKYAYEFSKTYGQPQVISAKMTDVPGHGIMLPAVLAGAGVKFLHLGCNEFAMPPEVPPLFFWQSPDGSRVLTMYDKGGYGSGLLPPEGWDLPVWMALMHTNDNCGPHSSEEISILAQQAQKFCPEAEIVSGSMDDFYRELSKCNLSQVPLVTLDLADTWIHGVGSYPREVSMVRSSRMRIANAKKLFMLSRETEDKKCIEFLKIVNEAYDNLILFGEHTWGLDVKTWIGPDRAYEKQAFLVEKETPRNKRMEFSWREQALRAEKAEKLSEIALKNIQDPGELSVFNPNGSSFTGWARLDQSQIKIRPCSHNILNGIRCPEEKIFNQACIYVRDVRALSAIKLIPCHEKITPVRPLEISGGDDYGVVENHRYRVEFCKKTGYIRRVFDKVLIANILEENNGKGVFLYQYDKYGSDDMERYLKDYAYKTSEWGIKDNGRENYPECRRETFYPHFLECHIEERTLVFLFEGTAYEKYGDAKKIELRLMLPSEGDELFVELKLFGKQETPYIESGSLVIPLAFSNPTYAINKNGCVLNPETDFIKDANHVFYCLEAFIAAQEKENGICVVTHDTPLVSIGETGVFTFRHSYEEHAPQLYFNLFNNMWGTNFPQWIGGDFTFRYTIFGSRDRMNVMQRALSLANCAQVVQAPAVESPIYLPEYVQVMDMEPVGKGLSLRLRDTSGKSRRISVRAKHELTNLCLLDFLGNTNTPMSPGEISFDFTPYAICTLLLMEEGDL